MNFWDVFGEMLDFVGDITVPLSLLVVGSLLAGMSAQDQVLRSPKLWLLTAIRLLLLPVACAWSSGRWGSTPWYWGSLSPRWPCRSSERDAAEHGVRRRHRVHGTDHLPDHGGVHRDHSHRRRAAALSLERKPICLTFNNWSPT